MTEFHPSDRRFRLQTALSLGHWGERDLENLRSRAPDLDLGELKDRRWRYSAIDIATLRILEALCGPTVMGPVRWFVPPAVALNVLKLEGPVHRFIDQDSDGYLKTPGPVVRQRFLVLRVHGRDEHATVDTLYGNELIDRLDKIDNQMLIVPVTKLVYEVVTACGEIVKQENEIKEELTASVTEAFRKAGRLEEDE